MEIVALVWKYCHVFSTGAFGRRTVHDHACTYSCSTGTKDAGISGVFLTLMTTKSHFLAVIADMRFPPLSLKIMFVRLRGPPIVLSASPLCMTALCRRCSTKQPHWNAANAPPLWHETHFIDTYFSTPLSTIRCI